MVDEEGTKGLQESSKLSQLRPIPPKKIIQDFPLGYEIDAYHYDGWWDGRIPGSIGDDIQALYFKGSWEQLAYSQEELMWNHKWVDGSWIPPFPQQDYDSEIKESERVMAAETVSGDKGDFKFKLGTSVEGTSGLD
ncbi:hypothetical protein KIW84_064167 [Lathyrus oleraceus]|uniref:Uncharacterized protein n=1 Tax=Pisum sativum TaxID=3888 RepID=A0A9D4WBU0_PEA|nr:hypothetical protein KIW84_064167 [Pisum sativum]